MLGPKPLRSFLGVGSPSCPNLVPERKLRHSRRKLIREKNNDLTWAFLSTIH